MIRFYNREATFVEYKELNRDNLLKFYFANNLNEIICVSENGFFIGYILYYDLVRNQDVYRAISKEYVILEQGMWEHARDLLAKCRTYHLENMTIPVVNNQHQLLCFAYEDDDANRELRILHELQESDSLLQFHDIYPQYKCVKIYEFNELAYCFAQYLKDQGVAVEVNGELWKTFKERREYQVLPPYCMTIYAEGTWKKPSYWVENCLRSVSVEFECIDHIYEENIKRGLVKDSDGTISDLIERLRKEKEILLFGIGEEALDAYDYLYGQGVDIIGFIDENTSQHSHTIFGKRILSRLKAKMEYPDATYIDPVSEHSAWGGGEVEAYDVLGYRRNKKFILLKDYVVIKNKCLLNLIVEKNIVLIGDDRLCKLVENYLNVKLGDKVNIEYADILDCDVLEQKYCFIVMPQYRDPEYRESSKIRMEELQYFLKSNYILDYNYYFSNISSIVQIESNNQVLGKMLKPKKVILGVMDSGNVFFRGILDNHPMIMLIDYNFLNNDLFWICCQLSVELSDNILPLFWIICGEKGKDILYDPKLFNEKMSHLLGKKKRFSSQELFVIFHMAYMYMYGKDMSINDAVIY